MHCVPEIKLIRTDTTLDLSQKAEKRYLLGVNDSFCFTCYLTACGIDYFQACWANGGHFFGRPGQIWSHNRCKRCRGWHVVTWVERHTYLTGK